MSIPVVVISHTTDQKSATFLLKDQIENISGLQKITVSITTAHFAIVVEKYP